MDSLFKFGVTLLDGIQGMGVGTGADRLSFCCRAHPPSRVACALGPTAIAVENPNLQVNYRQGFTIQGVYTQEELEATVCGWP